jgi:hypothetical protein
MYGYYSPNGPIQNKTHRVLTLRLILHRHAFLILNKKYLMMIRRQRRARKGKVLKIRPDGS